jgi:hypothetical protein
MNDLARPNELAAFFAADLFAMRRKDRRDGHQVGGLGVGIAKRKLERRKPILVHADAVREPNGFGHQKVVNGGEPTFTDGNRRLLIFGHGRFEKACDGV